MIQIQNTSKSFKGIPALQDLSLNVAQGEILGLLGANGAGKSTTINLLLGFLKPDQGTVKINDLDCTKNSSSVRKLVGYIPENVNLYQYLTGKENLDYFCKLSKLKFTKEELTEKLETCGLSKEFHNQKVSGYSKGMRQKVGIAIAYAKKARVYLLDEPASGLDPLASNELGVMLKKLASEGASILMASHDIFRVREICNRIGILNKGHLVKELHSDEVSTTELEQLYLKYLKG